MNLLLIIPYTPTPIRTRPFNLLRGLLKRGHQVTLATLWENETERKALGEWQALGVRVLANKLSKSRIALNLISALASTRPLQSQYCWQPGLMRQVQDDWLKRINENRGFDAVHVEHLRGAGFGLALKSWLETCMRHNLISTRPPIVWDSVDCISLLFEKTVHSSRSRAGRLKAAFDLARTRQYEGWLTGQFEHTLVTAEADRAALVELTKAADRRSSSAPSGLAHPITILPNGVDLQVFAPNYGTRQDPIIILTGKMSYHANVTAALYLVEEVMPQVWAERPDAVVQIVGANPAPEIRSLAAHNPSRVLVTGTVPDLAPYLQGAALAAAPIAYGVGIQNKVLEAMACATPVVCTPQATSALNTQAGRDVLVGGTPQEFAGAILRLLDDSGLRQSVGAAGRKYVEQCHSWEAVVAQLEGIYDTAR